LPKCIAYRGSDGLGRVNPLLIVFVAAVSVMIVIAIFTHIDSVTAMAADGRIEVPRFDHVVIVVEENRPFDEIINSADAPFINQMASEGALFTESYGITNASQPNYLALVSGSTHGISDNDVHPRFSGPTIFSKLAARGLTFCGYSEGLPAEGSDVKEHGDYRRKHNPMTQFTDIPATANKIFDEQNFPTAPGTKYDFLPTVCMVVPDQQHDMHSGNVAEGDAWLQEKLTPYIEWASSHNSLLILTFDEDGTPDNGRIVTIFRGAHIRPGRYPDAINHYNVLRTVEDMYELEHSSSTIDATSITQVWQ